MPTDLGDPYPPLTDRHPPHMAPEDYEIYLSWWPSNVGDTIRCYYDVAVGAGANTGPSPNDPPQYSRMWTRITQKRIDMIAIRPTEAWLIELRHAATANAVGRLLQYLDLYNEDPIIPLPISLHLVTNHLDRELVALCRNFNIRYHWT